MMQANPLALEEAVVSIRRTAGVAWEEFLAALAVERDRLINDIVEAPKEELASVQGRLQCLGYLMSRMVNAPQLLERAAQNREVAAQQRRALAAGVQGGQLGKPGGWTP